jgi:hypothetical protein
MAWCDPCAADPLTNTELGELGVRWIDGDKAVPFRGGQGGGSEVYVTRLHVRYDAKHFPEDLMLQETPNRDNFQGRYVLRHPWKGEATCPEAEHYFQTLPERFAREADTLANLTGWDKATIRKRMEDGGQSAAPRRKQR